MVDCIRGERGEDTQKASDTITYRSYDYLRWAPVVDNHILLGTPRNLRRNGEFNKAKLMISFTSQEGGNFLGFITRLLGWRQIWTM